MLETDFEMAQEGMTVPYPPLFDDVRKNHGFMDVRGRPELASEIAEGSRSPAMRQLLIELAQPASKIFSVGCDLGSKLLTDERQRHTAGGYVQIMPAAYAGCSPDDYAKYAVAIIKQLKARSQEHEWCLDFVLTPVSFKLDGFQDMRGSLWIWFHAFADSEECALSSREALVTGLRHALTAKCHTSILGGAPRRFRSSGRPPFPRKGAPGRRYRR